MSASARVRLEAAAAFVADCPAATEVLVVGATREAADDFCRGVAVTRGATFGLHRFTLGQLASRIATATLAAAGRDAGHRAGRPTRSPPAPSSS